MQLSEHDMKSCDGPSQREQPLSPLPPGIGVVQSAQNPAEWKQQGL